MDDRERELKFTLLGDPPDLEGLPELAGRALRFDRLEDQENTYLDTPDRRLSAAGQALRVRRADGGAVVTLKGPSHVSGSAYDRPELEEALPGPDAGVEDLPAGRLRDEVTVLAGGEPLVPLARLRTARRVWRLEGVGELSLDAVRVLPLPPAGEGEPLAEFEELELEAKEPGGADRLDALAETLRGLAAMTPSTTGKLGRALAAYTPRAAAGTAWAALAAETLARELQRLQAFLPVAQADRTLEGVHGLRVSCRRLRAVLSLFRQAWPAGGPAWRDLSVGLRDLGRVLGEVRDLDVLLERLGKAGPIPPGLEAAVKRERAQARGLLGEALAGPRFADLVAGLRDLTPDAAALGADAEETPSVADAGPDAARRALRRVRRRAARVLKTPETDRAHARRVRRAHDLRKAVKRLRYSLEFLRPVADTAEAVSALKDLQGTLGRLNDHANAAGTLRRLAEGLDGDAAAATLDLAGGHDRAAGQALDELPDELEGLHWARLERHLKAALRGVKAPHDAS